MNAEGSGSLFDAGPRAFGSVQVRERLADGRYGPVYLGHDPDSNQPVVVRLFEPALDPAQRALLLDALRRACDAPLQHVSIGRPLTCGVEHDRVYVVHSYLPGLTADDWLRARGPRPLAELVLPLAKAAAAIDFAAAGGVHHGSITARDVLIDGESAGVTGWGIVQARVTAGLGQTTPSHHADIAAYASVVFALLSEADAARVAGVFERAWSSNAEEQPATALDFVKSLQQSVATPAPAEPTPAAVTPPAAAPAPAPDLPFLQAFDAPLHTEEPPQSIVIEHEPPVAAPNTARLFTSSDAIPHEPRSSRWPSLLGVGVIMLAIGFAAGLFAGRRQQAIATPAPASTAARAPAANGQAFTDTPVTPPPIVTAPPTPSGEALQRPAPQSTPAPVPRPRAPSPLSRPERRSVPAAPPAAPAEATLQVDSRPRGAQVYVDGRLIGRTPTVAGGLPAGEHSVRLEMSGYRRWATTVALASGEHARVGGSLEEQ